MIRKPVFWGIGAWVLLLGLAPVYSQDLSLQGDDLRIEQQVDGGFHLYIRKKPGIGSVLLTESTRDPNRAEDNYAYRSPEWNPVNGDEPRLLDGVPIPRESGIYSLIDSSPETHPELGQVFHIYIPYILHYGYADTRHGEVYVTDGAYLNIRTFALPYGDYRGGFQDNPFILRVAQKPLEGPPEQNYMKDTVDAFREIARAGHGDMVYSEGPKDLVQKIEDILMKEKGKNLDMVLCLDTTSSMKDDIDAVRNLLIPMLSGIIREFAGFRIGMVLYKDYFDEYLTRIIPFTTDFRLFQQNLNAVRVSGGRDIPEAVYEALYEGAIRFSWEAESRLVILVGDAPPHPRARGSITKSMVDKSVEEQGLKVHAIILPQ
ncbi:MAG: VWA domain-containing protein [Spirochaetaceae bacterium]|nr:VWA domain-containing protein [Spirochaetaceae bacterium]